MILSGKSKDLSRKTGLTPEIFYHGLLTVLARGKARKVLENLSELRLSSVADAEGYFADRQIGFAKQAPCLLHSHLALVLFEVIAIYDLKILFDRCILNEFIY